MGVDRNWLCRGDLCYGDRLDALQEVELHVVSLASAWIDPGILAWRLACDAVTARAGPGGIVLVTPDRYGPCRHAGDIVRDPHRRGAAGVASTAPPRMTRLQASAEPMP